MLTAQKYYRLGFCLQRQITINHFQKNSNPSPSAVRHERQVCYDSATQSLSQFDVSFPEKLLTIVATGGEIFSLKFGNLPLYELGGRGGVMGCDIIIGGGGLPNVTLCDRGGGVRFAVKYRVA